QLAVVEIDLDHLRVRGQALPVAEAEVEGRADDQDDVGVAQRLVARADKQQRVVGGQGAAGGAVEIDRHAGRLRELPQLGDAAALPDLAAGQHRGPLGGGE